MFARYPVHSGRVQRRWNNDRPLSLQYKSTSRRRGGGGGRGMKTMRNINIRSGGGHRGAGEGPRRLLAALNKQTSVIVRLSPLGENDGAVLWCEHKRARMRERYKNCRDARGDFCIFYQLYQPAPLVKPAQIRFTFPPAPVAAVIIPPRFCSATGPYSIYYIFPYTENVIFYTLSAVCFSCCSQKNERLEERFRTFAVSYDTGRRKYCAPHRARGVRRSWQAARAIRFHGDYNIIIIILLRRGYVK